MLPFANLSADKEQDYFSDGLAEEILNLLAKIPGLKVISRTSSFAFRGKDQDVPTIAHALGVEHVLEGSVRKSGNRLRISAQLIQASDGARIWSERFDRDLADVFAIQDEIGQAISAALQMQLAPPVRPVALDAYQDYLKGQYFLERVTPDAILKAKDCFERAAIADPTFAPAFSSLALQQFLMAAFGVKSAAETVPAVRSAAMQALAIDPHDGEAHSLLATVAATFDYDWELAEQHHRQALASNTVTGADRPRRFQISTNTLRHVLWYLGPKGRGDQAVAESRAALETDPLAPLLHYGLVYALNVARRYDEAVDCARRGLEIDAAYHLLLGELSTAQLHLGAMAGGGRHARALRRCGAVGTKITGRTRVGATSTRRTRRRSAAGGAPPRRASAHARGRHVPRRHRRHDGNVRGVGRGVPATRSVSAVRRPLSVLHDLPW